MQPDDFQPREMSFEEALKESGPEPALLLGNGFSIDYDPDRFRYEALADKVLDGDDVTLTPELRGMLCTDSFEEAIRQLEMAARVVRGVPHCDEVRAGELERQADGVRADLVRALAKVGPDRARSISDGEYRHAKAFRRSFGTVFTLNYDPLLYWVINQNDVKPDCAKRDGFDGSQVWQQSWSVENWWLHGSLLFRLAGNDVQKLKYDPNNGALMDQVRKGLEHGVSPLVITEGSHVEKLRQIEQVSYFREAWRKFRALSGSLFLFGVSLSDSDLHVNEAIADSRVSRVYVGHRGGDRAAIERVRASVFKVWELRRERRPDDELDIVLYPSSDAHVWRD